MLSSNKATQPVSGEFIDQAGERFYAIKNVDKLAPFFTSIVSNCDHWLFVSSTGGLTAGRVSPETALFPYVTVDKIHDSALHTGSKTLLRVGEVGNQSNWEPFNKEHDGRYNISRHLYKNLVGNKLRFEEVNHDLQLVFSYTWQTSSSFGFVRQCELKNLSDQPVSIALLDGLQNILPANTPREAQTTSSNLVDAYKWTELDEPTGTGLFTLYSGITDRAEPCESLKANTVFCLGLDGKQVLLSSDQLGNFRCGESLQQEVHKRGIRGAYLINQEFGLAPQSSEQWQFVANVEQSQSQVVALLKKLENPVDVAKELAESVNEGTDELARIMAGADGFQATAEEVVSEHHYANVLFNTLRGGIFDDQYSICSRDFANTIKHFNLNVFTRNGELFEKLPAKIPFTELATRVNNQGDAQLDRLFSEYLPITFGRRHGDPSRPWNQFAIKLKDENGDRLLSYQGNWRDIFQNWEALAMSYPEFVENMISKFLNASTIDGYNPYRITKEGIDWEVEEPEDPWSYIGYWGDHQIIYLLKLLELSNNFHPEKLSSLLHKKIFSYSNVPYRLKDFDAMLKSPKDTVEYSNQMAALIEKRVANMGADGKLVLDEGGKVYQVNLIEKLLVPLLSKLGNLVVDGGIWLNTQRPEWNDANNALVGHGLSMVTLHYVRRYITFLQKLLKSETQSVALTWQVSRWMEDTNSALKNLRPKLGSGPVSTEQRLRSLRELGTAASRYRQEVYADEVINEKVAQPFIDISALLDNALAAVDHSIGTNQRADGLHHAYNLLNLQKESVQVYTLYPMLEGQVAALSSGSMQPKQAVAVLESLFDSNIYRADQKTFMLYPDRELPGFLSKNQITVEQIEEIPFAQQMLDKQDERIVQKDAKGGYRFNADLSNAGELNARLNVMAAEYSDSLEADRGALTYLYEAVFHHKAFTGRSGGMFGFEGLGCIYWHMIAKLLLAVQENYFSALNQHADQDTCQRLGDLYYRVRDGIGFNKTPAEFGAFPTDPYSHTPKHAGAQQPGMTGQVKEEILSRFAELGLCIRDGKVSFQPSLLREREFCTESRQFRFLDVDGNWQELVVPAAGLAFTWCQVPVVYRLSDGAAPSITITWDNGEQQSLKQLVLPAHESSELFQRTGRIRRLSLVLSKNQLFSD